MNLIIRIIILLWLLILCFIIIIGVIYNMIVLLFIMCEIFTLIIMCIQWRSYERPFYYNMRNAFFIFIIGQIIIIIGYILWYK